MTKPSLSAVHDLNPSKTSPCSRCQHAEFIHAYSGPCHLGDRKTVGEHLLHRVVALLHHADLHEHDPDLLSGTAIPREQVGRRCQRSTGTPSQISRNW